MKRFLKWLGILFATIVILAGIAVAYIYWDSGNILNREYDFALEPITVESNAETIAKGKHLALTRGCFDGCHGKGVSGQLMFDEPWVARLIAPDLTRVAASYSDSELERVIRRGVRKNGKSVLLMPSSVYFHLTDDDVAAIIAFLRSLPKSNGPEYKADVGILARIAFVTGEFKTQAQTIAAGPERFQLDRTNPVSHGNYLALTLCSDCHGADLSGGETMDTPDLVVANAYDLPAFTQLMREGKSWDGRELGEMAAVAQNQLMHLTDEEIAALHGFLQARILTE